MYCSVQTNLYSSDVAKLNHIRLNKRASQSVMQAYAAFNQQILL